MSLATTLCLVLCAVMQRSEAAPLQVIGIRLLMELTYTLRSEPTPEEQYRIIDPLIAYNEAQVGPRNKKDFAFFVKSESGDFVGGLLGFTHFNHFFVSALYVDQGFRNEGIGRELMARAEALALEQGAMQSISIPSIITLPPSTRNLGSKSSVNWKTTRPATNVSI